MTRSSSRVDCSRSHRRCFASLTCAGAFEFGLLPAPNPSLDESRIVIGEVLDDEGLSLIAELDALPTRQPSKESQYSGLASLIGLRLGLGIGVGGLVGPGLGLGTVPAIALGLLASTAVGSDPRAAPDLAYRPLVKVRLVSAEVLK